MSQQDILRESYKACLAQDRKRQAELAKLEYEKIFQQRQSGQPFNPEWTAFRL